MRISSSVACRSTRARVTDYESLGVVFALHGALEVVLMHCGGDLYADVDCENAVANGVGLIVSSFENVSFSSVHEQ